VDKYNVKSCVELFGSIISDIAGFKILTLEEMFHHLEWLQKIWIHQFRLHTYEETEVMKKSSQKAVKLLEIEVEELEAKNDNIQTEYSDKLTQINKEKREVHMKEIIVADNYHRDYQENAIKIRNMDSATIKGLQDREKLLNQELQRLKAKMITMEKQLKAKEEGYDDLERKKNIMELQFKAKMNTMEKQLKAKEEGYDDLERKMNTMEKQFKAKKEGYNDLERKMITMELQFKAKEEGCDDLEKEIKEKSEVLDIINDQFEKLGGKKKTKFLIKCITELNSKNKKLRSNNNRRVEELSLSSNNNRRSSLVTRVKERSRNDARSKNKF
jgi:chromosome segregation ATPase